ncbi:MAG: hypothetical protein FKGGLIKP_00285 [Sodalis sp. Fse]|nr:MAG: hypothetical protein FKGGLIKP_00285 [Sodalis sp. Fse]UVK78784.1 MAG: hypothetical protein IGNPGNKH_00245 [Sodalis sp. Ffu]
MNVRIMQSIRFTLTVYGCTSNKFTSAWHSISLNTINDKKI